MNPLPRILIGCPTHILKSDSLEKYVGGLDSLTYDHFDVVIEDNSPTPEYSKKIETLAEAWEKKHPGRTFRVLHSGTTSDKARARLVHGRNRIRQFVLDEKYDYFLSLEQDVVPPVDVIERLLNRDMPIVSGVYLNKVTREGEKPALQVMAGIFYSQEEEKNKIVRSIGFMSLFPSRLIPVAYTGLGCILIRRDVLENVSFRYQENDRACDDIYFCSDAREKGYPIYLDSSVLCAHHFNDAFKKTPY